MMKSCAIPTPEQRRYGAIHNKINPTLMRKVHDAISEAAKQAEFELRQAGLEMPGSTADYFTATVHQNLYCTLCKADPSTFSGGKPEIAVAIIRNSQNIAKHYWGANIEPFRTDL